ncbi:MAG: polyphosphate polymerase domain-containing protein [Paludibacter sp.]
MDDYIQQNNINTLIESVAYLPQEIDVLNELINTFEPISLEEMDAVHLMNRVDTKFLIGYSDLPELLKKTLIHYRVLEINDKRILPYSTIYFDTESAEMYMMHHNRKLSRFKIRRRSYIESGISFIEIKSKSNKGRTTKHRIPITKEQFESRFLEDQEHVFLNNITCQSTSLIPKLQNTFRRITLVDKSLTERVTLDIDLSYQNLSDGICKSVEGLVIIEMKQEGARCSLFRESLNELRVSPGSMSKYCLGMVLVNPNIKSNRFKNKLRTINKITNNNYGTF